MSSCIGSKPEKDANSKCSLFIRGIPAGSSNDELLNLFSDIGPLRSCFVVNPGKEAGAEAIAPSKFCYGFVRFVTEEDAQKALEQLKSTKFKGSKLKLEIALKKHTGSENKPPRKVLTVESKKDSALDSNSEPKKDSKLKRPKKPQKDNLKSIYVSSLPKDVEKKQLFKKFRKFGNIASLEFPLDGDKTKCLIVYSSGKEVSFALPKIHDHIFKGSKLKASLTKEQPQKSHRLIVRNISFSTTKEEILDKFSAFGEVFEVQIPKKADNSLMGFCFVQYLSKSSADEAILKMNATKLNGRKIAIDYAVSKTLYEKIKDTDSDDTDGVVKTDIGNSDLSDDDSNDKASEAEMDRCNDIVDFDDHSSEICNEESCENEVLQTEAENIPEIATNHLENHSKTLFVRNLLFETESEKVAETFSKFGKLQYVRIVKDFLGRSKGCAFVSFVHQEDASKCLDEFSNSSRPPSFVENSSSSKSLKGSKISLDLYDQIDSAWVIEGRHIDVLQAIPKLSAKEIASKTAEEKKEADKRNLYLLKESFVDRASPEWEEISEMDKQKRVKAYQERSLKLKNLNCFVSKTRVSIRNMPVGVDEKQLKTIIGTCVSKAYPEFKPIPRYLKQVKVIRDKERKTSTGELKSLGYAFVEFSDHKHALSLIRKMNNKKDIFTAQKRPIVEFAVENSTILARRQGRMSQTDIDAADVKKVKRSNEPSKGQERPRASNKRFKSEAPSKEFKPRGSAKRLNPKDSSKGSRSNAPNKRLNPKDSSKGSRSNAPNKRLNPKDSSRAFKSSAPNKRFKPKAE